MRRIDDDLIDPEIAAELDAIDATLAGEPVDPRHAEIAELALLLAAERPEPRSEFGRSLDQRVARRFAPAGAEARGRGGSASRRGWFVPLTSLATAGVAAIVAVVVLGSSSTSAPERLGVPGTSTSTSASVPARPRAEAATSSAPSRTSSGSSGGGGVHTLSSSSSGAVGAAAPSAGAPAPASTAAALAPSPVPNARKIIQSAQLALSAAPNEIGTVAQEIFNVVGRENGVVNSSQVTSGAGGYAQFQLSVPSSALEATMTSLSQLAHATVSSRTDATQDVNGQYLSDRRKLADDRALRTSLLKQLANATTTQQIDSLRAQIRDAEASISSDEATLRGLDGRVNSSQIMVTINSSVVLPVAHGHSGSFTLGTAAHDAGRVLTVAAGVALITLAALVPVALIAALVAWIALTIRRRRREQALDLA